MSYRLLELTDWLEDTGCKWDMWRSPGGAVCVMIFTGDEILNGQGPRIVDALEMVREKYERLARAA